MTFLNCFAIYIMISFLLLVSPRHPPTEDELERYGREHNEQSNYLFLKKIIY